MSYPLGSVERMIGPVDKLLFAGDDVLGSLDAEALSPAAAARCAEKLASHRRRVDVALALCAARGAESDVWREAGDRSPAHWLARLDGCSPRRAGSVLAAVRAMDEHPALGEAFGRGELSWDAAALIGETARAAPAEVPALVDLGRDSSLAELRQQCTAIKLRAKGPREADERDEARRRRYLRRYADGAGAAHLELGSCVEDIAQLDAALRLFRDAAFDAARACGEHPSGEALGFDALATALKIALGVVAATNDTTDVPDQADEPADAAEAPRAGEPTSAGDDAETPETRGAADGVAPSDDAEDRRGEAARPPVLALPKSPPVLVWRVDHSALVRGHGVVGETCELSGHGPVPVISAIEALARGAACAVVSTDPDGRVRRVAHLARAPGTSANARLRRHRAATRQLTADDPWWIETKVIVHFTEAHLATLDPKGPTLDRYQRAVLAADDLSQTIHLGRQPTAKQRSALQWRDPTCRVKGCTAVARLEIDHHVDWATTRHTTLDELGHLCGHHHRLRTRYNYELDNAPGKHHLTPPEHHRQPRAA